MYDYVIVGSGPSGLAFAHCCSKIGKKILIIENEKTIGGCHRVIRAQQGKYVNIFTEHGPRVYSSSYKTFDMILRDMNTSFKNLFVAYDFSVTSIAGKSIAQYLSVKEFLAFTKAFFHLLLDENYGLSISMKEFMSVENFAPKSKDIIDRACRLLDGASADRFSLNQFLQLLNKQFMYGLYQPVKPNDEQLFPLWMSHLKKTSNVVFMLHTKALHFTKNTIHVLNQSSNSSFSIPFQNLVLAIPPSSIVDILQNSAEAKNIFGNYDDFRAWSKSTKYDDYICMTFHWENKQSLPKIHGFPLSNWGLVFIVLSDYMTFSESFSKTVISVTITMPENPGLLTGKVLNDCSEQELYDEVLYQLKQVFNTLPEPSIKILSPNVFFDGTSWLNKDTAFIKAANQPLLSHKTIWQNVYTIGSHTNLHNASFTGLESALVSGVRLAHKLHPDTQQLCPIQEPITIKQTIIFVLILIVLWRTLKISS